jgi:hypothetical protein
MSKPLFALVILLIVAVVLYLLNTHSHLPARVLRVINIITVIATILWLLLYALGVPFPIEINSR